MSKLEFFATLMPCLLFGFHCILSLFGDFQLTVHIMLLLGLKSKMGDGLTEVEGSHVVLKGHIYSVSQKSSPPPPKTFCNIFTQAKYISMKFCQFVATL